MNFPKNSCSSPWICTTRLNGPRSTQPVLAVCAGDENSGPPGMSGQPPRAPASGSAGPGDGAPPSDTALCSPVLCTLCPLAGSQARAWLRPQPTCENPQRLSPASWSCELPGTVTAPPGLCPPAAGLTSADTPALLGSRKWGWAARPREGTGLLPNFHTCMPGFLGPHWASRAHAFLLHAQ